MKHEMIVQDEQGTSQVGRRVAVMLYTHLRWDQHMMNHSLRVALYAKWLARKLGLPDTDVKRVEIAAIVHDIGKLRVPSTHLKQTRQANTRGMGGGQATPSRQQRHSPGDTELKGSGSANCLSS